MTVIEVRITPAGKLQARRIDGEPMTRDDWQEAKRIVASDAAPVAATRPAGLTAQEIIDIDAGKICAVIMDCDFGPLLLALRDDYTPGESIPVFYASELPFLRKMDVEELARRYAEKRALGEGWIRNRIEH